MLCFAAEISTSTNASRPDTAEFLRATFGELNPTPVYIAPGNHDWFSAKALYSLVNWTPNVTIFQTSLLWRG